LESAGFVAKQKNGRVITPAGASFLDGVAYTVSKENQ
ncbi:MAG: 30S ribosomal protein S19e, partial [Methanomicrobiales archaeon]|nr:30S ribosomal protein S19e [Methanomicrobiales archaeon]